MGVLGVAWAVSLGLVGGGASSPVEVVENAAPASPAEEVVEKAAPAAKD